MMTNSQYNDWLRTKDKGILRYLLTNSVVCGSIYFAVMYLFLDSDRVAFFNEPIESQAVKVIGCFMFGIMWAWGMWYKNHKFEKTYLKKNNDST